MKKNLVLLLLALFIVAGFSSCRKNRTCECTYTDGSVTTYNIKATKKVAKLDCDLYEYSGYSCELK